MSQATQHRAGFGRVDISSFVPGTCMFGWGHPGNVAQSVAMPLFARALVVEHGPTRSKVAYVCCDLGMISEALRHEVLVRLAGTPGALADAELVLSATHTHAAPTGYSTYLMYALSAPGFSARVLSEIAGGIVGAIEMAIRALTPARLYLHAGDVPLTEPILFNRSPDAYSANHDVTPVPFARRDEAVDRTMTVLRVDAEEGRPLGIVTWLACHPTTIHREATYLHPDHKGESSRFLEEAAGDERYVAIFAQGPAGDVTANHRMSPSRKQMIGAHDDDRESARFAGVRAALVAKVIADEAPSRGERLEGPVVTRASYTDFFRAEVAPEHAGGREGLRTGPPRIGLSFGVGTAEGPGPLAPISRLVPFLVSLQRTRAKLGLVSRDGRAHGSKVPFWELGRGRRGRALGFVRPAMLARHVNDPFARYLARAAEDPRMIERPWVPRYLPAHVLRIGHLLLVSTPNEPTTVAGRRLAKAASYAAGDSRVRVLVCGYTNAYAGYVTTPEEYALQRYEGGATLFGEHSLAAFCTIAARLVRSMQSGPSTVTFGPPPPYVKPEDAVPAID